MNLWLRHLGPNEWVLPQFLYLIIPGPAVLQLKDSQIGVV